MPSRLALLVIVFVLSSLYLARSQSEEALARAGEEQVEALDWLAGSWSGDMWGGRFHAFYSTPEGGTILSHSRLLKEGQEAFYEFEVFALRDGVVHLQPFPRGAKAVGLRLHSHDAAARTAVFENPAKDYPSASCSGATRINIQPSRARGPIAAGCPARTPRPPASRSASLSPLWPAASRPYARAGWPSTAVTTKRPSIAGCRSRSRATPTRSSWSG